MDAHLVRMWEADPERWECVKDAVPKTRREIMSRARKAACTGKLASPNEVKVSVVIASLQLGDMAHQAGNFHGAATNRRLAIELLEKLEELDGKSPPQKAREYDELRKKANGNRQDADQETEE